MENSNAEKRKYTRMLCNVDAGYTSNELFGHEYITDISLGGVFVETGETFPVGQKIRLSIPYSMQEKYVKVEGTVVRVAENGIGVKFHEK